MRGGMGFIICGEYVIIRIGPSGEIGIHVCLRSICHLVCRFKSCLGHHDLTRRRKCGAIFY